MNYNKLYKTDFVAQLARQIGGRFLSILVRTNKIKCLKIIFRSFLI